MTIDCLQANTPDQDTPDSFAAITFPNTASLFGCPEVIFPLRNVRHTASQRSTKQKFWRSLLCWTSGYLTDEQNKSYHKTLNIAARLAATHNPVEIVDASFEPWLLRTARTETKPTLTTRIEKKTAHKSMVYTIRARGDKELTEPMQKAKDRMEHRNPQFFLRNIGRCMMEPAEELPLIRQPIESGLDESTLKELRKLITSPIHPEMGTIDSLAFLRTVMDPLRYLLFRDPWHRYAGQELKSTVNGPLWQYFPDEQALKRYGGKNAQVLHTEDTSSE